MSEQTILEMILEAKDKTKEGVESAGDRLSKLKGVGELASKALVGVAGAGLGLVASLSVMAVKTAGTAKEVTKLSRELGLNAEQASKLRYVGNRLGLDVEGLSLSFGKFSKYIVENRDKLAEHGVAVALNAKGNVDFDKTLGNVADRFARMPDGVEKSALAMELFGKSGKDLLPLLNKGSGGLKELGDEAKKLGLVLDEKSLAAAKRYTIAQKDMNDALEGARNRLGVLFLPVLADGAVAMAKFVEKFEKPAQEAIEKTGRAIFIAKGIIEDIKAAARFEMKGGGDFLASIIGPTAAATFMDLVARVSAEWQTLWVFKIRPAIEWAEENIPRFWEGFKAAIVTAWGVAKPKLDDLVKKLTDLKERFDGLPEPMKKWAEATVITVAAAKATGLDDVVQGWANAIGNLLSGASAAGVILSRFINTISRLAGALAFVAAAVGFVLLLKDMHDQTVSVNDVLARLTEIVGTVALGALFVFGAAAAAVVLALGSIGLAIGQVIVTVRLIHDNWNKFVFALQHGILDSIPVFGPLFEQIRKFLALLEEVGAAPNPWEAIVVVAKAAFTGLIRFVVDRINGGIEMVNKLISAMNLIPGVSIPLIAKIEVLADTAPAATAIDAIIARYRDSSISIGVNAGGDPGGGPTIQAATGFRGIVPARRGGQLFRVAEGGEDEHVSITPVSQLRRQADGPVGGGGNVVTVNVATLVVREEADVERVARAIDALQQREQRRRGVVREPLGA